MLDLLSRLSTTPSTPPPKSRSPNIPSPLPQQSIPQPSSSTSNLGAAIDPSTSLKQLLGLAAGGSSLATSPQAVPATPVRTKLGDSGYIPSPQRNDIASNTVFDKDAAKKAVLAGIKRSKEDYGSGEESVEGQREFVRQLLNSIHVSLHCLAKISTSGRSISVFGGPDGQGFYKGSIPGIFSTTAAQSQTIGSASTSISTTYPITLLTRDSIR